MQAQESATVAVADVAGSALPVLDVGDADAERGGDAVFAAAGGEQVADHAWPVDSRWFYVCRARTMRFVFLVCQYNAVTTNRSMA